MKLTQYLIAGLIALAMSAVASATTLEDVKKRGELNCVVSTPFPGFANTNDAGVWVGFDVDFCRAVAAAVLGDAKKVKFVPTTPTTRFTALNSGEGDVLFRNTTWTFSRDVDLNLAFQGVNYYDGQGFIVKKSKNIKNVKELDGATICVQTGTTTELNLASYFKENGMSYDVIVINTNEEAKTVFFGDGCDAFTTDQSGLASTRASADKPEDYVILPEVISKEPLAPATRQGDEAWGDIVRWVMNATITAEELGVTSANAKSLAASSKSGEVLFLLGKGGVAGKMLGLSSDWGLNVITQVGNYGEIFERNIGAKTALGLSRGANQLWSKGGLLYSPPFR